MSYVSICDQKRQIWVLLGQNFLKNLLSYFKSAPLNLPNCKILSNNANAEIWDQNFLILVFFGKIFQKTIVIFEISTLKRVYLQTFTIKVKYLNLGPNASDLRVFGMEFEKNMSYLKSTPSNFLIAKFCEEKPLIFAPKFSYWVFLRENFQKLLLYLKSILSNLSNCKIL